MAVRIFLLWVGLWLVAASAQALPLRVVVVSDLNGSYGAVSYDPRVAAALEKIIALEPDLVISTGDMVAGQQIPYLSEGQVRAMWAAFHATVSEPLAAAGIPFAVTPGNHDASAYGGFERERAIYAEAWEGRRPQVSFVDDREYPFYYVFDLGGVRFASLDATVVGALPAQQMDWLEQDMQGGVKLRIVFSHLPLWPFAEERETEVIGDPDLAALYRRAGIDLHLSGHHHAFYPGASEGVALVGQACLGSGPRRLLGAAEVSAPGFTVLEISDAGVVTVSAYQAPGFDEPVDVTTLPASLGRMDRLDRAGLDNVRAGGAP